VHTNYGSDTLYKIHSSFLTPMTYKVTQNNLCHKDWSTLTEFLCGDTCARHCSDLSSLIAFLAFASFSIAEHREGRGLFAPRVEYDEWTPLGHGDPLKNNPTYDYMPPVLERVRYWSVI
jgi:hypothetical protein